MNVLIIEDEEVAVENLEKLLKEIDPSIHIQARIDTVKNAVNWLSNHETELIFMDIHLADDISFKIFEQIEVNTPVIFITAYDQYAIKAFQTNSIDYLLKPIESKKLIDSLQKFRKLQAGQQVDFKKLLESLKAHKLDHQKRFIVASGEKIKSILDTEIAYFYAQERYVFLISKDNQQYLIDYTLEKLEEVLDPQYFFRVNRQFIIAFESIKEMYSYPRGRVKIDLNPFSKTEVIVSIQKASEFKQWLNK